jgi:hypothetical protein
VESVRVNNERASRRYFVVCAAGTVDHWWNRFLQPHFHHAYLLIWEGAVWLHVDPAMDRTRVVILDLFDGFEHPREWIDDPTATIIEAWPEPERDRFRVPWIFSPLTCVEGVKACLGIRKFWCFTPRQLMTLMERRHESKEAQKDGRGEGVASIATARTLAAGRTHQREKAQDHTRPNHKPRLHVVRSHDP